MLEGIRLVSDAAQNGAPIEYVLATQKALSEMSECDFDGIPIFEIPQSICEKISQTQTPQGAFAVCKMLDNHIDFSSKSGKYLMLCDIQDNGNLGMIMRSADALGATGVILSNCCDVYSPKTVRATMGSIFRVNFIVDKDTQAMLETLARNGVCRYAAVPDNSATDVSKFEFPQKSCVLIGNEGNGLERSVIDNCDASLTIRMKGTVESLNAAMAAGIMLYELCGKDEQNA